jgi:hypothetical protein
MILSQLRSLSSAVNGIFRNLDGHQVGWESYTGKLKIAIKVPLLPALEAMAETMVK